MGTPGLLVVKRYRLVRALGQGGMGVVWEGHDELLDRPVAVKEIVPPPKLWPREEAEFFARVARSATGATRVAHTHLVATYDVAEDDDGHPWIVMEPFQARSLDRVIANDGPLTAPRAAEIGRPVLDALAAAHAAGVVHGDVKPANVLIGYDGRIALSDLGVAPEGGTPGFAAPEGAGTGPAADLWSLGATLYAAMVGAPPAPEPTLDQMPGPLRPVLWGLLAPDPAKRLTGPQATHMLTDLLPELLAGGKPAVPAHLPDHVTARAAGAPAARRRAPFLIAAAAVLVAAGGLGGWALLRSPGDGDSTGAVAAPPATTAPATTDPSDTSAVPTAGPTPTPARLPLKWYRPGTGWKAAYPRDWTLTVTGDRQEWAAPDGAAHFAVQVIDWGGEDPLFTVTRAEREVSEAAKAYRKIRLERIEFPGARAAEWEGRWKAADQSIHPWAEKGVVYHELRRVIFTGKTTTILTWVTTGPAWTRLKPTLAAVLAHYHVPEGDLLPAPHSPTPS